jgi:hypothetical protein
LYLLLRKKPLTPIIAGSICGGLMLIIWIIGFAIYFRKRARRRERNRLIAAGKAQPREKDLKILEQKVVIPPDPAVLLGHRKPGEMAFPERQNSKDRHMHWPHNKSHSKPKGNGDSSAPLREVPSTTRTDERNPDHDESVIDDVIVPSGVPSR